MTNTTKPYYVMGLSLVAILAFSIGMMSINVNPIYAQSTNMTINKILDDKLLERNWNYWKYKYTEDEFLARMNIANWYIDNLKNNPSLKNSRNADLARDLTVIYNFHTMTDTKKEYGQEVLALIVGKQMASNGYAAEEPVKRFHDWLINKYAVSSKVSEIDNRLKGMGYDRYSSLMTQVADAYIDAAKKGIVPYELFAEDPSYWGHVSFLSFCQLDETCPFDKTSADTNPIDANPNDTILGDVYTLISYLGEILEPQKAYAITHYTTFFFYQFTPSNGCIDGMSCPIADSTSGTGPVSLHFDSNGKHARGSSMSVYAVAYDQNNYQSSNNRPFA